MNVTSQHLASLCEHGVPIQHSRELVIARSDISPQANRGYQGIEDARVVKSEGRRIPNLRDLAREFVRTQAEFLPFECADGRSIVLDRALAADWRGRTLNRLGVPRDRLGSGAVDS